MIKAIFACDIMGHMGNKGSLPWPKDKEDLKRFKETTTGHVVVMGSKTWSDPMMPKPLPNRICVVVSKQPAENFPEAHHVINGDLGVELNKLEQLYPDKTIWIIGGPELLMNTWDHIKEIDLTLFMDEYEGDASINIREYILEFNMHSESFGRNKTFYTWTRK